jgi:indolepyruvate ferredoxin oxidoreductase
VTCNRAARRGNEWRGYAAYQGDSPVRDVTVEDKYLLEAGMVMMTGIQALVRLPMLQRGLDRKSGLNTAGFISGYRGSPLGAYDLELWKAKAHLEREDILFQPGVNEDLAATAVWGTQTLGPLHKPTKDGIFAIWYGKGPGVDRSGDPLRHGNIAGTHPNGGVLVVAGDDHAGKSSSIAHQSESALMHAGIPVLAPSNVQDILDFGLLGFAMSRYTGLYAGLKVCNEVIEQTMTVEIPAQAGAWALPERGSAPPTGFHNYPSDRDRLQSEIVVKRYRLPLVERFLRANHVNRILVEATQRRLGIVTAGKAVQDVRQALSLLGLSDAQAARLGISVYKLGCVYPLEPQGMADFARGQEELLFIEEKNPVVEHQAKVALYGQPGMPRIVGKTDEDGVAMIACDTQLEPLKLAIVIGERLRRLGIEGAEVAARVQRLIGRAEVAAALQPPTDVVRAPYFCSGCPHNTGTRFPEGSVAAGGIGCHAMAMYSGPEMLTTSHMGGEGAHWYSVAHFSGVPHIFQNMGDGTYYHSGLLAIRGAIAANVNMTFKILFNDAVAMTGGQPVDGPLTPGDITRQVLAEGVKRCVLVTDRPDLYGPQSGLADGVAVHHRDQYDAVQRQLRQIKGVTVVIYEQTCAAEKRRRRKRDKFPDPPKRMFIHAAVCEGCGDCSTQSNCVSLWPKETELGRKREIDQSNCNKDYSCVKGFCPSFVTVLGAEPRKPKPADLAGVSLTGLPSPAVVPIGEAGFNLMISGIGGTGVVTVGALLGMAAHLEGKACSIFDMTGLSVKNGAVFSHVRIAANQSQLRAAKLGAAEADLALAFDAVAALSKEPAATYDATRTRTVANARIVPVAAFQRNPDLTINQSQIARKLTTESVELEVVDATGLGLALVGDAIAANLFLLGYACQRGLLPVTPEAVERAVEINGVAIAFNKKAFALGRFYAIDPTKLEAAAGAREINFKSLSELPDIVAHRSHLLTAYQNAAYAERYRRLVQRVAAAEEHVMPGKTALAVTVARNFARLMAYKDEYEVARLYSDTAFKRQLREAFEDGATIRYNLAPPLLAKRDPASGHLMKREFGPWMGKLFPLLAKMKGLRGTSLDLFGYTAERRMERGLIDHYEMQMTMVAQRLTPSNHAVAIELAGIAAQIRGFGHVKEANVEKARALELRTLERFHAACASAGP